MGAIAPSAVVIWIFLQKAPVNSAALRIWQSFAARLGGQVPKDDVWNTMPPAQMHPSHLQPASILMVDDARSERVLLRQAIYDVRRNLRLFEAGTGQEARDVFRSYSLDLVFLDVELPGASGLELLPYFRQADPQVPIVMVTHHNTQDVVVQALRQGAFGFIVKPYNLNKLREIFAKLERRVASETLPV
jgi:CheY-like chemotaxis protein